MDALDILEAMAKIPDRYILEAHSAVPAKTRTLSWKKTALIAAIAALMLLLVGCVAVLLGLQDLHLGRYSYDAGFSETGQADYLSLQGFVGSPGYQAALRWQEFLKEYDPEGKLREQADAAREYPPIDYMSYECYSQEMREKIDSLCEEYGLEILGPVYTLEDCSRVPEAVGLEAIVDENRVLDLNFREGYFFRGGSFQVGAEFTVPGEPDRAVKMTYRCVMKTAFDGVCFPIQDLSVFTQWNYTPGSGETLLLALGPERSLIIGDLEQCFVTAVITPSSEAEPLGQQELEAIADRLLLDRVPQPPDPAALIDPPWFETPETEPEWTLSPGEDPLMKYLVRTLGGLSPEESGLWFTERDYDGNNTGELLLGWGPGKDANLHELVTLADGEVVVLLTGDKFWLCEENIWERRNDIAGIQYIDYFRIENGEAVLVESLLYSPEGEQAGWSHSQTGGAAAWNWTRITGEEAAAIQAGHPRTDPYLIPLSEYPHLEEYLP